MNVFVTGSLVTKGNCVVGARVQRGPDWTWGNQDYHDAQPGIGTIKKCLQSKGVHVTWDGTKEVLAYYRNGAEGKYDLIMAYQTGK